jgi:nicotinamidase-related amidase
MRFHALKTGNSIMTRHFNLLHNDNSALLIIDVQEKFRKHIAAFEPMAVNIVRLIEGCKLLDIPIFVTEQYPKGLGKTISEILNVLPGQHVYEKTAFSCCGSTDFSRALQRSERKQVIVCGIEAHVCVNQTVHDLLSANYSVHLIEDAISSRDTYNKEVALRKMALAGAIPSTTEMSLLELVQDSASAKFKDVQNLIK